MLMLTTTGKIHLGALYPNNHFTKNCFYNGVLRYVEAAIMLGMDDSFRDCHSMFMVDYSYDGKKYGLAAEFVFNEAGENSAAAKIDFLIDNPSLRLIASPRVEQVKYAWPGAIRIPFISQDSNGKTELIIANSGVPEDMDIILIAAFALGLNEINAAWSLENFYTNNQYAWALRRTTRLLVIARELEASWGQVVEGDAMLEWVKSGGTPRTLSPILQAMLDTISPWSHHGNKYYSCP